MLIEWFLDFIRLNEETHNTGILTLIYLDCKSFFLAICPKYINNWSFEAEVEVMELIKQSSLLHLLPKYSYGL